MVGGPPPSSQLGTARGARPLDVTTGGNSYFVIPSGSAASTPIDPPTDVFPWAISGLINTGAAQTNAISIYDCDAGQSTSGLDPIWTGVLPASTNGRIPLEIPLKRGLVIVPAGTTGADILVCIWS